MVLCSKVFGSLSGLFFFVSSEIKYFYILSRCEPSPVVYRISMVLLMVQEGADFLGGDLRN